MYFSKNRPEQCHVITFKNDSRKVIVCTTKVHIANELGISVDTLDRHIDKRGIYEDNKCIILLYRDIVYSNRKFRGKRR